jgi:dihydrofolate reductase
MAILDNISIIVAVAANDAIGRDNQLLWHIPADLKRFKQLTTGHTLLMGKKTFYSLPLRPLPNRRSIVLTNDPGETIEGCEMAYSIEQALQMCDPCRENFVIGGGSIYRQFMPLAGTLYITRVHHDFEADTFFDKIDPRIWQRTGITDVPYDEQSGFSYSYEIWKRK